ncbi:MAG TPA: HK97 gp10 family phage protein [Firmicutes bacterium]|nr:HK97 gp10 family phage protein [Bacillota bacterium]
MAGGDEVVRNLRDWAERRRAAVVALAQDWAGELEARAKKNAPWKDRTGNARNGLTGGVLLGRNEVKITLAHSVSYGVFLELARDGRYAILKPTLDAAVPEIYRTYERMWRE